MGNQKETQGNEKTSYEGLDRALLTAVTLLEGITTLEEAFHRLETYLEWHRQQGGPEEFEVFLKELFYERCRKEFPGTGS